MRILSVLPPRKLCMQQQQEEEEEGRAGSREEGEG